MADKDFPGNSHKEKEATEVASTKPKLEKVIDGEAEHVQKSKWAGYLKGALIFVGTTVVLPMVKDLVSNGTQALVDGLIYGEDARNRNVGSRIKNDRKSYDRMYRNGDRAPSERSISDRGRSVHDFGEITLNTRNEGQLILDQLGDRIRDYDAATVSDLYDLVGITGSFTDSKWGWTDLRGADVRRGRGGYVLVMPATEPIE